MTRAELMQATLVALTRQNVTGYRSGPTERFYLVDPADLDQGIIPEHGFSYDHETNPDWQIASRSVMGQCLYAYGLGNINGMFTTPIPPKYKRLYLDLQGVYYGGSYTVIDVHLVTGYGISPGSAGYAYVPTNPGRLYTHASLRNYELCTFFSSHTPQWINDQEGIQVRTDTTSSLGWQVVEIDLNDITVPTYLGFHTCHINAYVRQIYAE